MGEMEGTPFISMEYVDGEDLRSLLRRIGRLPGDKAIEIARKLCAGLAAAHGTGVLHRDLKPANIMIDGEGQVHIMDFGLAALAADVDKRDVRSGTPAYMAPEQAAGQSVSTRSDIYSLGMVLFEMFTGQRAFDESSDRSELPSASSIVGDVDPAVETVIRRCLDQNPAKRPDSALDVARALPGGDPLAEALAAGDTPSPEMVAASDDTGVLSVRAAIACLGLIAAGLVVIFLLSPETRMLSMIPAPDSPDVLTDKAREIAVDLGYVEPPADSSRGFIGYDVMNDWVEENLDPDEYRAMITSGRPWPIRFWYRQSPRNLVTMDATSPVTLGDPPGSVSGMVRVVLDLEGRLLNFTAVPPQIDDGLSGSGPVDWGPLFDAAGLDRSRWTPTAPEYVPALGFDERAAWTGAYPEAPSIDIRIEASVWNGRTVFFNIDGPCFTPTREVLIEPSLGQIAAASTLLSLIFIVFGVAVLLAWHNYRRGRGGLQGASRLAAFAFGLKLIERFFVVHHVFPEGLAKLGPALADALFFGGVLWVLYLAVEPYVRRRWPQRLISWTRVLGGHWRDPVVGGHLLVGVTAGVGVAVLGELITFVDRGSGALEYPDLFTLRGSGPAFAGVLGLMAEAIVIGLGFFVLYSLLRVMIRREWIAEAGIVAILAAIGFLNNGPFTAVAVAGAFLLLIWITRHFGVLPLVLTGFVGSLIGNAPMSFVFTAWYSHMTIISLVIVIGLAAWSFYLALGGRRLIREDFMDA